jgi:hypothetical protein
VSWRPPWRRPPRGLGIRLRITGTGGELVNATSEQLYLIAKYGGAGEDGWLDLLSDAMYYPTNLRVEVQCHVTTCKRPRRPMSWRPS